VNRPSSNGNASGPIDAVAAGSGSTVGRARAADRRSGRPGPTLAAEDGAASVQVALVVVPALFAVLILALQFTFAWMASAAVQTAAENAADAASARNATEADALAAANRVLDHAGYATMTGTEVSIGAETVRVELRARAYQFLPVAWEVTGVAESPVEDFRSSEERR
jgi:Flp pilus assembly protein TadG